MARDIQKSGNYYMKSSKLNTKSKKLKSPDIVKVKPRVKPYKVRAPVMSYDGVAPRKLKPREKENYVNGKEFERQLAEFYEKDQFSDKLAESVSKIAHGLSFAPNFINYSYKDEMVGDAIVKMLTAVRNKKFRLNSGFSPFSYFTTIAFHAFINRIKKEKKQHEAVKEYREKKYAEMICSQHIPNGGIYLEPLKNDDSDEYDY